MKSFFKWFRRKINRLSPLENAVLESVIAAVPQAEGQVLRAQLGACSIERAWGHKLLTFSLPDRRTPVLEHMKNARRETLATVKVTGLTSHFTTTATVIVASGLIAEIRFDPIPWCGPEKYLIECQLRGLKLGTSNFPETVEEAGPGPSGAS